MFPYQRDLSSPPTGPGRVESGRAPGDLYPHAGVRGSLRRNFSGPTNFHPEDYRATDYEGPDQNGFHRAHKPFSRGHYAGKGPRAFQKSDERLHELVCDFLTEAPDIDPTDVEVRVKSGVITLEGTVPTRWMKRITADAVESLPGVLDVHNNLQVKSARE